MKLITFTNSAGQVRVGWLTATGVVDMHLISQGTLPVDMLSFITNYEANRQFTETHNLLSAPDTYRMDAVTLVSPLPKPNSFRDFIAFETHLKNATARFGDQIPKEWYEVPIFYFSNHNTFVGDGAPITRPANSQKLDYELEIACIIGKEGKDISADEADAYIFGYSILNDWTARDLQAQEMRCMLGPAKGKDFATSLGPFIATKDELEPYRIANDRFDMTMTATVNGKVLSEGNFKDIHYTFAQMIERASAGVTLYPGDVLGSGTVGWGCLMESGASVFRWLEPGDEVELAITGLGKLTNRVV